jgi:hypothetical protein
MSCKTSIDDVQQLAQTIENEYDIQAINRTQELNQRFDKIEIIFFDSIFSSKIDGNIQYNLFHNEYKYYKIQLEILILISIQIQWNIHGNVR